MVDHNALIRSLCDGLTPLPRHMADRRLALGLLAGAAATVCAMLVVFGVQPGLQTTGHALPLVLKLAYVGSLALLTTSIVRRLGHPDQRRDSSSWRVAIPIGVLAIIALVQLASATDLELPALAFGSTWRQCPARVAMLSIPIFAGLIWALRGQAPVDLRAAGAAAGLTAGSASAAVYAFACAEHSAAFVLAWYSLGIVIPALVGAALGPRLLRW